ncbi:DUF427 domain-containing protein [Burkholderia pseudomultivorans]|uniref:DUF427 domain-containing protein n=1 Tax=Burkholderia pseudomultivorans TaxID=1207504 RepID=UPI00287618FC|nr:DUF427 domain-containing protein [Burkholderia pseudomultivorans]MDS0859818.1 DUF427 domain-containing protein [Burkholderia pseudomultivorans]
MDTQTVRIPGPDHPITVEPAHARVVVKAGGRVVADTLRALTLREASYPAVFYIPREDADMSLLSRTEHKSWCPYKGEASYYSITPGGARAVNAIWSYETPHEAVSVIRDHLAFYPDRVDSIETSD